MTYTPYTGGPEYNRPYDQYFYISTPSLSPVNYTIKRGSDPAIWQSGTVDNSASVEIDAIPVSTDRYFFINQSDTQKILTDAGFIIEADKEIYVSVRFNANVTGATNRQVHAGAMVSKGDSGFGNKFRVAGMQISRNSGYLNFGSVMATENGTQVTITVPAGQDFISPVSGPITILLNKGESYVVAANNQRNSTRNGTIGTLFESNKPVVVNSGGIGSVSQVGDPGGNSGGFDYGIDQIVSAEKTGNEYIFIEGGGRNSWENVLLIADQNNTSIKINGNPYSDSSGATVMNEGEYWIIEGDNYDSNGIMHIVSDNPNDKIFAYQFTGDEWDSSAPAARQSMFFVPPLDCGAKGNVNKIAQIEKVGKDFSDGIVTIVTKNSGTIRITDGSGLISLPSPITVSGTDYVAYKVSSLEGDVKVEGDEELYVAYLNYNDAATTGSFYSGFQTNPQVGASATFSSLGPCIKFDSSGNIKSNVEFTAKNGSAFDGGLEWQIFDATSNTWVGAPGTNTDVKYVPSQEGRYRLKGLLTCKNQEYFSNSVRVNICAGDFDDDGILDNVDLDIDNDGILNSFESRGKGNIDFTNQNTPLVTINASPGFPNPTSINNLITGNVIKGVYDPANGNITPDPSAPHTFTGYNDSRFESQVKAGANQVLQYKMDFSSVVNVRISDDPSVSSAVITGETFIIETKNSDESITLLDPDDNLLVYSETDDVFEYGISEYTSGLIKFKFNPASTSNTFQFTAFEVEGITITHQNTNTTSNSVFVPLVELYDYELDSDGDSINDLMQLDSDGDGCFDVVEAGYLEQDDDGIYGLDPNPNIADGTVDDKGRIVDPDYNYTIEPIKNSSGAYLFQYNSPAPTINIPPVSTLACYEGAPAEFEVTLYNIPNPIFQWQLSDDGGTTWVDLVDNTTYSGVITRKLTISSTTLAMKDNLFRVKFYTDEYACYDFSDGTTKLSVEPDLPIVNTAPIIEICDDTSFGTDIDGKNSGIDLTIQESNILGATQPPADFILTYHLSSSSAEDINDSGITDPDDYTNTNPKEDIFVRVQNKSTLCFDTLKSFSLSICPKPVVVSSIEVEQCDDGATVGQTNFDLTKYQDLISTNYANEDFEYYTDSAFTNPVIDKENYPVNLNDEVFIKVISDKGCVSESKMVLKVGVSQIPKTFVDDNNFRFSKNSTQPPGTTNLIETWDVTHFNSIDTQLKSILPSFSSTGSGSLSIRYFSSLDEAQRLANEIIITAPSFSYTMASPNKQEIWALVTRDDLTKEVCEGLELVGELYVEPRPVAYDVTIPSECDGSKGDNPQDGIFEFDTSTLITQLLTDPSTGLIQNISSLSVSYSYEDSANPGTYIDIPEANIIPLFNTETKQVRIVIENIPIYTNATNQDAPARASDTTFVDFIVDDTPEINTTNFKNFIVDPITNITQIFIDPHCDGDDGLDDTDGFDEFDTSTLTDDLLGPNQTLADYDIIFTYFDEDGNTLTSTDNKLRNPFNISTLLGKVDVVIENKLNRSCPATAELYFVVNPLPEFTVDDDAIVCLNLPPIRIGVESASDVYTYTWEHTNLNGTTSAFAPNDPTSANNDHILIGEGGTYHVTATTTDGTNCSRTLSIEVEESEIATVTLDDITVEDLTSDNNNTITIDTSNLGLGDYEFAIDDPFGPYQNDPFFEQVRPGIHTIYIRDKNDCGIAEIEVSVIGYKKFFTPNGDGIHDTWRILGIREDFQPNSRVYIFDRYGKLIKELDPITEGWDGTYLGRPMPQTDYWFRVFLEDGREFKGHFSLVRGKN